MSDHTKLWNSGCDHTATANPALGQPPLRIPEVLAVEDSPDDADLLRRAFAEWESALQLTFLNNGDKALAYLRSTDSNGPHTPDLILLDLDLPGKNGIEVLEAIKTDPRLQQIPVLILTTSTRHEDIQTAYRLHANGYLIKTVNVKEFFANIKALEQFWFEAAYLPSYTRGA